MAKKKNKKNTQKQVEVAAPPESPKTTAPPTTEEPPANEAPPPEVASDEAPVGSTSVPEPSTGDIQDKPSESEPSPAIQILDSSETADSSEPGHMGSTLAVPEEDSTVQATDPQQSGATEEEESRDISPTQPVEADAEATPSTQESPETPSQVLDTEDAAIEAPMADDLNEETPQVEVATETAEPVATETEQTNEQDPSTEAQLSAEDDATKEATLEAPLAEETVPESPAPESAEFVEAHEQLEPDEPAPDALEAPLDEDLPTTESSELPAAEAEEAEPEETLSTEAPEAAEAPEVPEVPEALEVPEAPEVPEVPEVPEAPEVSEAPEAPEIAEAPEVAEVPEEPELPAEEQVQSEKDVSVTETEVFTPARKKETAKQRKKREAEERKQREEKEQEEFEQYRIDQERLEMARLEQKRLEREKNRQERLEQERLEQEKADQEKAEQERLEQERLEQERVEQEKLEAQRLEEERVEKEKAEAAEAEAARLAEEEKALEAKAKADAEAEAEAARLAEEEKVLEAEAKPTNLSTPPPEALVEPSAAPSVPATDPVNRLPTPATTVDRSNSPRSVATDSSKKRAPASERSAHAHRSIDGDYSAHARNASGSSMPAPKPQAVSQLLEESRPPAPSPPIGRVRPRHIPTFDSEDDSDSALIRPRRQYRGGEEFARDGSSGSGPGYPPQPTHHRSVFASRVPAESTYSNPPPPQPPGYHPGNHPGFYPPSAPPHYPDHNYRMSQPGYSHPNSYGPPSHSSSSPYAESWNYQSGYRHNSPPQRHDTLVSRDYPLGLSPLDTRGDDPGEVFSRIAQAIPDLHVLLARYKETHGQLSVREELLRRSAIEQEEKLRIKDGEIAELKERSHNLEQKYSTEASRLRLQIGNLEEQARELQEQRTETEKYKKEAQDNKTALDEAMRSWEAKYKELEEAHTALARTSAEEKAKAYQDFDEWKSSYTTRNDAEKIALAIQFDKRLKEADVLAENQRQEVAAAHVKEKDELRSEHQRQQLERQASFERVRNELETKLGTAQIDREEALKHERESREVWLAERESLIKSHQDDRESIRKGWDEQRDLLEAQYKKSKDESDKAWMELHADATKKADEEKAKTSQLVQEKEDLQKSYNTLKAESEQEKSIIKSVAGNLEAEKSRLEKLMECYGDIAEIKSKGDTYYLVSFSQLQKQIIDLATTHFVHLPVRPPAEELAQVPSNLPSFLGDTQASRQVRAAYVAHTVSKLITYRVFGPFLFSLGRRYDKADSLFLSMSHHIRDKSTRKEAIWRQQTLLAAFTSSGAKQRINTAAGSVVEEIVNAIKHFADPREEEGIKIAVKRIVKLAAETWRFARLEREMINATMPALLDEEHQFTGPEYWPSYETYKPEGTLIGSLVGTSPPSDERPQLLLRLFPVIWREAKHENFHADGEKPDEGCTYHHGLALYDDAEPVIQRMEELKSAGLPSYTTTASPTIAESGKFPPPIVPPPREAPPPPPAASEKGNRSTIMSTPPSPTQFLDKSSIRSTTPPPPPSSIPTLDETSLSEPVKAYKRPPPGPIDFQTPRDLIGMPLPVEAMLPSQPQSPKKTDEAAASAIADSDDPPPPIAESVISKSSARQSNISRSRAPSAVAEPPAPASVAAEPADAEPAAAETQETEPAEVIEEERQPTPAESAIIPATFPEPSPNESKSRDPPTPPLSRSGSPTERPISPLFEAIDEIEALQSHRSRQSSSASLSRRRSTHSRRSKDEMPEVTPTTDRPETNRRTSGYALSTRSAKTVDSERTDRSDRTERTERSDRTEKSGRDPKSRYMCESRSAAVKALYPNSPLATPNGSIKDTSSSKNSVSSSRNSISSSKKRDRDSKELKREKSFPDNGTWDTSSNRTSEGTNTQISTA